MIYQQFKGAKLKALVMLYFTKHNKKGLGTVITTFETELGFAKGHPNFRELAHYLIESKVLLADVNIGSLTTYYIERKELKKIIEDQDVFKEYDKYLDEVAILMK